MARSDATQTDVLTVIVAKLRSDLSLNERNCFVTLEPMNPPIIPKGGDFVVSVAPGEGAFVEGEQYEGNVTEEWTIIVTAYARTRLDSTDHDQKLLQDATRGLLLIKGQILASLVGADPAIGGDEFARDLIFAQRAERPIVTQQGVALMSINFGVHFDWSW